MSDSYGEFLANYPPDIQAISQRLRTMLKDARPDGQEVLYAKDNHIGYSFTGGLAGHDRILYICPMTNYVGLGFMRGTRLPDPDHLLVGEGKWQRHLKIKTMDEANRPAVEALVKAAWNIGLGT